MNRTGIACRDEAEYRVVKQVAGTKIAPGIRALRDKFFLIMVDHVTAQLFRTTIMGFRLEQQRRFSEEKNTRVVKISWLSRKDTANHRDRR